VKQAQIQKTRTATPTAPAIDDRPEPINETALDLSTEEMLDELDEILNEMDEDFALKYVQRGGQ
jgi:ubiquitin-like protein Pup